MYLKREFVKVKRITSRFFVVLFSLVHLFLHVCKIQFCRSIGRKKRNILIVSHELSNSGAPLVLVPLVHYLNNRGDCITLISPQDGQLKRSLKERKIPVFIVGSKKLSNRSFCCKLIKNYDFVLVNTIAMANFINCINGCNIKVLWWIHEGDFAFKVFKSSLPHHIENNVHLFAVSEYSIKIAKEFCPFWPSIDIFQWGIDDMSDLVHHFSSIDEFKIVCVGGLENRKGQLLLAKIIKQNHWGKVSVWLAGRILDAEYATRVTNNNYNRIHYVGELSHEKVLELIKSASLVCIPSIDEPVSAVAVEAMMLSVPVLVSSHCGVSSYIIEGKNGYIFENNSERDLEEKIRSIINLSPKELSKVGQSGRYIYEKNFTYDKYIESFERILGKL